MIYKLSDLLMKMGAPEAKERGRIEWHYFDKETNTLAGQANIRLEAGGEFLVAELKHTRKDYEDDDGMMHGQYEETFFMYAERAARPGHYRITRLSFDGEDYGHPTKPIIELGLSIFHARALDISVRMIEQVFNKMDILAPAQEPQGTHIKPSFSQAKSASRESAASQGHVVADVGNSNIIPFRPRAHVRAFDFRGFAE